MRSLAVSHKAWVFLSKSHIAFNTYRGQHFLNGGMDTF